MIIVIDYDAGNTANVLRALKKIGVQAELSSDPTKILAARGLILPGVGAYPAAMAELTKRGLVPVIKEAVAKGAPLLGICLGMQVLTEVGLEHQETKGLGFIPGVCREIKATKNMPVPHMGWNELEFRQDHWLKENLPAHPYVYFVHSYHKSPVDTLDVIATADYGQPVPAICGKDNVVGFQFHPEKSGKVGEQILQNVVTHVQKGL